MSKDGGPAFPELKKAFDHYVTSHGMTLRDYFAGCALNQRRSLSYGGYYAADAAREAYEIADAMLAERANKK